MGKVKGKHRLDKYYHLAKDHGYRSRAAWKLVQLNSKFNFLESSRAVLDLCAAPGGWMQVSVQLAPVGTLVVGVDLDPIRPIRGAIAVQEDITQSKCRSTLKRIMAENGVRAFDLVLHDGSPNVGGAWAKEATSQNALVIDSVRLATELLAPKGNFVTKVFRSQDYTAVLFCLRQLFEKVEVDKPLASRSASAEIYLVGLKYKAPAKIDPRLLDVKHLFQGIKEAPKILDVLRGTKQKRHRDGYEDGDTTLRKLCSAVDFIYAESPLDILGSVASITFKDPESLPIKDHTLTTEEVKALCEDLRVLGKQDFKHLLKWRMNIKKALSPKEKVIPAVTDVEPESKEEDEEERVLNEMEELTNAMERKKKRAKKIVAKRQAKDKARKALGQQMDGVDDSYIDQDLFSLSSIKEKKDLVTVDNDEFDDDAGDIGDSESDEVEESDSDLDSEEERKRYDDRVEELLDEAYEQFVAKKDGSSKQRKRSKQKHADDDLEADGGTTIHSDQDSDNDDANHEANPLMVPLEENAPSKDEMTTSWYSQDVFMDADDRDEPDKYDSEDEMQVDKKKTTANANKTQDSSEKPVLKKNKLQPEAKTSKANDDFEIVPAPATDSDSSTDDESDEEDIGTKAEIIATAKKMLTKKKREDMLDDAYNKYMFHDDEGLPKWFVDEENKHRQLNKPITKEEVNAIKAQFKEIDARPAKKVAEAKARKKRATHRKLEKVRKKANTISDQADISERSKNKMIGQLYNKAQATKKPEREYVVAKKGVQVRAGKGKVLVDRRMKKDARKHGMSKTQGKGGKKGNQKGKGPKNNVGGKGKKGNHKGK
ncbi:hypothetical protein CASFOL_036168 [Castilleja foliolosa]|uniref:Putative rRNA methyltransferase n=1 Tax=Castilleja foliolosa TaxID=1961234 RepID=A0ABD3BVX5_9LAMI